ncbi:hypothetical protein EG68_02533 [Paragonimus skrjabini miyazakii]|uniref:Uncharacterized protein n=1 Tax=Paragonimus skrjabini miyazakii TaxID=59628 RepID=A0A8S9Z4A2_9TREM|nr:hypothetical protein EG68_02533 [Paragonimus skrjabini miyazakii]
MYVTKRSCLESDELKNEKNANYKMKKDFQREKTENYCEDSSSLIGRTRNKKTASQQTKFIYSFTHRKQRDQCDK